jgi:hypothetical protein
MKCLGRKIVKEQRRDVRRRKKTQEDGSRWGRKNKFDLRSQNQEKVEKSGRRPPPQH